MGKSINFNSLNLTCSHGKHARCDSSPLEKSTRMFFYLGLCFIIVNRIFSQIGANIGLPFLANIPLMTIAIAILLLRFFAVLLQSDAKRALIAIVVLALSFVSYLTSGQSYLPSACLLICGVGNVNVRDVLKVASISMLILVAVLGVIQFFDWLLTGSLAGSVERNNGRVRISFYFAHPNTLAALLCMSYVGMSASWKRLELRHIAFGIIIGCLIIVITDSKTSALIVALYLLIRKFLETRDKDFSKCWLAIYAFLPVVCLLVCIVVSLNWMPTSALRTLNQLLTGRPGYWLLQHEQLGHFTLFGQQILTGEQTIDNFHYNSVTIDCFYATTLLQLGVWSFIAFYFLYIRAGQIAFRHKDVPKFTILLVCAMFGFTEVHMIDLAICTPMLLLGENLFLKSGVAIREGAHGRR